MDRRLTRRSALKLTAAGGLTAFALPAAGTSTETVFVYPVGSERAAGDAVRDHGGTVTHTYDNFEFIAAQIPQDEREAIAGDSRVARVADDGTAQAVPIGSAVLGPGCEDHPTQDPSWGWERIGADDVGTTTGAGVDIAVLDTGIDGDHCDLTANVAGGINCTEGAERRWTDRNGHGSHCAGIADAVDNETGVVGVETEANLWGVKVLTDSGYGQWSDIICGIDWCLTNDREILSMSLGGAYNETAALAITQAANEGHLVVAAAGNGENDTDGDCEEDNVLFPATHEDVVGVGALDPDGTLAGYSSVGDGDGDGDGDIDLLAPGTDVFSTWRENGYATLSGTSMACPHVSGTAALVWERLGADGPNPDDLATIRSTLQETAVATLGTCEEGHGLVRADQAVEAVE